MHKNTKVQSGVLGASGYVGRELLRLVSRHGGVDVVCATSESEASVDGVPTVTLERAHASWKGTDVVFSCLPHGVSAPAVSAALSAGARVIDLSADFRLKEDVVYGLTEAVRPELLTADLVANPGCYPTGAILGVLPLAMAGFLDSTRPIVINAASGVTGAGRSPKRELLFAEVAEDYRAYGVGNTHRHLPEIITRLKPWTGDVDILFTPHLLPVKRGILTTLQIPVNTSLDQATAESVFLSAYEAEPCIEVFRDGIPSLRDVVYRNLVAIGVKPAIRLSRPVVTVVTAIDNLLKGAAGQALQNMNVMFGLDETRGLP